MTNVEALKALYVALGGDAADVADATTITAVLNAIAAKYEGADDATTNAEAIANITAVLDNIIPEPTPSGAVFIPSGNAFSFNNNLQKLNIPEGVTGITQSAFYSMGALDEVILPSTLETIATYAFRACSSLKTITIPSNVNSIGSEAFLACNHLTTITINKPEGSITGAPWGAPSTTQVVWTG